LLRLRCLALSREQRDTRGLTMIMVA
jgi:hypothetical protein